MIDLEDFIFQPPEEREEIPLCAEQYNAVTRILESHEPVMILTGLAGSGKSTVIKHLKSKYPRKVAVCATTGRAAMENGSMMTADSLFGFRRDDWKLTGRGRLERAPRIVIVDEASMVGVKMYEVIREQADLHNKRLVLVGDWTQAKPVKDEWIVDSPIFMEDEPEILRLVQNHRQGEGPFLDALNKIRLGKPDESVAELLKSRTLVEPPTDRHVIRLYATNREADTFNSRAARARADAIRWPLLQLDSMFFDRRDRQMWTVSDREKSDLFSSAKMADQEPMTYGSRVMISTNDTPRYSSPQCLTPDRDYINGDLGELLDLGFVSMADVKEAMEAVPKDEPCQGFAPLGDCEPRWLVEDGFAGDPDHLILFARVRLDRNGKEVLVSPLVVNRVNFWKDRNYPMYAAIGLPLYAGYAITIHKSQGGTLDNVWVSLKSIRSMHRQDSKNSGWHGLAYVGLSRARTLEGLFIDEWDPEVIVFDEKVKSLL